VTASKHSIVLPPSLPPLGLQRQVAAAYVGVSPNKFDEMVSDGRMPKPRRIDGLKIWLRPALDAAAEALPTDGESPPGGASDWD
jgi:predicted DNA-binding transcriptional regulator AlpA